MSTATTSCCSTATTSASRFRPSRASSCPSCATATHGHSTELDVEVRRLADAAQAGKLTPEELRGGTFTVTSAGRSAGLFVTPLINHPEVAILGVHRIEDRAVVRDGEIVVRKMGNVSVTFDHRVIDGKRAADFGLAVIAQLQTPSA